MKKQIASISGGSTSHFMAKLLIDTYGKENVDLVYCDTGAEHPKTYSFIKNTESFFEKEITTIRLVMPLEFGKGCDYEVINTKELMQDFVAFKRLMAKYGRPYIPAGKFCTDQMKTQIFRKYCDNKYGKGNYDVWIGYRNDTSDQVRAIGRKLAKSVAKHLKSPMNEAREFFIEAKASYMELEKEDFISKLVADNDTEDARKVALKVYNKLDNLNSLGYRFLLEISDFDKKDILDWWEEQDFFLDIPNHCGNCVFCIEKSPTKLAYLVKSQPLEAEKWLEVMYDDSIAFKENRKFGQDVTYIDKLTFKDIIAMSETKTESEWLELVGMERKLRPCASGECSLFTELEEDEDE